MSARKRQPAPPAPEVGDYVIVAHQLVDPEFWWVSRVEWAEKDQYLVRDTQGWHPSQEPCLLVASESCLAFGTSEDCHKLASQARSLKNDHIAAIREATVALDAAQGRAREAIRALVEDGNRRLHGDITAIEP
jgi:hypothetical protein